MHPKEYMLILEIGIGCIVSYLQISFMAYLAILAYSPLARDMFLEITLHVS